MTDKQPEALWLADELDKDWSGSTRWQDVQKQAAAELRRLHEVNADLIDALQFCSGTSYITDAHRVAEETLAKAEGK